MKRGSIQASRAAAGAICRSALSRLALFGALISAATTVGMDVSVAQLDAAFETPNPAMFVADDGDTTIYLFGTMHYLPCVARATPPVCASGITQQIREAIAAADEVWLETNLLGTAGDPMPNTDNILFDEGARLSDFISTEEIMIIANAIVEESWAQGYEVFPDVETAVAGLDLMKPWVITQLFAELTFLTNAWTLGVDYEIAMVSEELGVPQFGFETEEELIALLAIEPFEYQVAQLRSIAVMLSNHMDYSAINDWVALEIWEFWHLGQLDEIALLEQELIGTTYDAEIAAYIGVTDVEFTRVLEEIEAFFPLAMQEEYVAETNARLVTQRNLNWMADIEGMLDRPGTFFIAAGAAHLVGEFGLPALLEGAGATVTRVQ